MQSNSTAAAVALQSPLTPSETAQANLHLQQTRDAVIGAIRGLSEAQWKFRPVSGCWSIAEIAEHIVTVQERVLTMLRDQLLLAPESPAGRDVQLVDSIVIHRFPNRLTKFPSPEFVQPAGNCKLGEVLDRLVANTTRFSQSLELIPELRGHVLEAPPLRAITHGEHTVMDGYQWILAASAHTERHVKQILEVRADANFPAA